MTGARRDSALAPFAVRSFRFQWPADLATSWAFEMETIILGWYVLVETESVLLLTVFASLQYAGTLIAPIFGVVGDRIGYRTLLCAMRAFYSVMAITLAVFALLDALSPAPVFVIAALMGLVRPSDLIMRYALVGETMPASRLMGAMGVSRTTTDSARVAGALAGAGIVATLGMGYAYVTIAFLYAASLALTFGVAKPAVTPVAGHGAADGAATPVTPQPTVTTTSRSSSPLRDLVDAFVHVWRAPQLLAGMCVAFLVNLTAFPLVGGLMPYVAKEVYRTDQTGLGWLAASFAFGALIGSIGMSRLGGRLMAGRMTIAFCATWYVMTLVFAQLDTMAFGIAFLVLAGMAQTLSLVPLSVLLIKTSDIHFRGRVLGLRMLAIYGLPVGLLSAGPLIAGFGYRATATAYCIVGLAFTGLIAWYWGRHLWARDAPANAR